MRSRSRGWLYAGAAATGVALPAPLRRADGGHLPVQAGQGCSRSRSAKSRRVKGRGSLRPGEGAAAQPAARGRGRRPDHRARAARAPRAQPRVGARDRRRRARHPRRAPRRRRRGRDPPGHLRGRAREVPGAAAGPAVIDVRRHNAAFCRDHFLHHCEEQVRRAIHVAPHDRAGRAGARRGVGRQGLARAVGHPRAPRLRRRRPLPRPRHRRVLRRVGRRTRARSPTSAACTLREVDLAADVRLRRARGRGGDPPRAVRRVRALEAPPVQLGRARARLRRRRHRPQPRRRGRGAARQRAALGHRLPRPPAPGAARRARLRAQGEAARAARRARDGGVLRAARHRLPGRGVPDGRGQPAPRVQGGAQRARGPLAGHEGRVPLRLPRARPRALRGATPTRSATTLRATCAPSAAAPDARPSVCAFCRLASAQVARDPSEPVPVSLAAKPPTWRAPFAGGRPRAPRRRQAPAPPRDPRRRRAVPHPRRGARARRRSSASPRAITVRTTLGAAPHRGPADARASTCSRCRAARR